MSLILEFSKKEKQRLIKRWTQAKIVGDGAESICYQIDDYVYKVLNNHFNTSYDENNLYNDEIDLKSFLFPEEIYVSNNKVFASKTKYIQNEISERKIFAGILPDIDKIKLSLIPFIKDIYTLSKKNILAIDLAWRNLIFDGKNLYAIDTMHYVRNEEHYQIDAYKWNISQLEKAMFEFTITYEKVCKNKNIPLDDDELKSLREIPSYIKKIAKQVKKENKSIQKIKRA